MAYEKTNWIDNETKVSAAKMNKIEEKLFSLDANKVDKDGNKVLSTEDYTSTEKAKVANLPDDTNAQLAEKVDKVTGKGLSTNDYTTTEKNKLAGIPADTAAQLADIEQNQGLLSGLLTTAKTSLVNAINELFNSKANKAQENWTTPTLLNGWTNDSVNGFVGIRYMKDTLGFVHIEGGVNNPTSTGAVIFSLPAGYRKTAALIATASPTPVRINSNGDVFPLSSTNQLRIYLVFKAD